MSRALLGVLTVLLGLVGVVGAGASPALAEGELGLSHDGRTWSDRLPGPLFDPAVRWGPGDVRTRAFYVRNQAAGGARLRIEVSTTDGDRLRESGDLTLSARVGRGPWVELPRARDAFVRYGDRMGPDDRARVRVRAALDGSATNRSQSTELRLRFRVVLTDAGASSQDHGPGAASPPMDGALPGTGTPVSGWLIVLAASLVGVGVAMLRRRREVAGDG